MANEQNTPQEAQHEDGPLMEAEQPQAPAEAVPEREPAAAADELAQALAKAADNWELYLRTQAEMENLRRRAARDVESASKYALEKFITELLPVKDSLELGLAAASGDDQAIAKLREGTELTLKMLVSVLQKFGVEEVNPVGEPFNPEFHQAMSMQESADHPPNSVVVVYQKGYLLNDRLVRPAMVAVAKAPANAQPGNEGESGSKIDEHA